MIGVPARGVIGVIEECAREAACLSRSCRAAAFAKAVPKASALQDRMLAIARGAGMRIVGPNCLGIVNVHEDVYAGFGSITRPPKLAKGAVSLVTQSGGFGYSIALACAAAGIGFRNVIATGNEADIDAGRVHRRAARRRRRRTIILAYIEGLAERPRAARRRAAARSRSASRCSSGKAA